VAAKRREALRNAEREGRIDPSRHVTPGAWTELEHTVYLEQAA
jgi:hypothetical protein